MIELYAITEHPGPPLPEVPGLREVSCDGLSAVCAQAAGERDPTAERLWHHEQVVEKLMDSRDVLPVRYGTCAPDERAVAHALERRRDELTKALTFVRGAVEVSLRVLVEEPESRHAPSPARSRSGTEYLRERAQRAQRETAAARAVHEPLRALARADSVRPPALRCELLRSAYLLDRQRLEPFTRLVAALQSSNRGLRLLCTGPWPPYSFVER